MNGNDHTGLTSADYGHNPLKESTLLIPRYNPWEPPLTPLAKPAHIMTVMFHRLCKALLMKLCVQQISAFPKLFIYCRSSFDLWILSNGSIPRATAVTLHLSYSQDTEYFITPVSDTSRSPTHPWSRWPLYRCRCRRQSFSSGWEWGWRACRTHTASGHWLLVRAGRGWWRFACAGSSPALRWSGYSPEHSAGRSHSREWSAPSGLYLPLKNGGHDKYELLKRYTLSLLSLYRFMCLLWGRQGPRLSEFYPFLLKYTHTSGLHVK